MSDVSVSERRIRPIQDAVTAGNWKQALQLCDKWQKKGEKSDRFLALKASILVNQPDRSNHERGKAETLQLCRRANPVVDIEAIHQLQDSLKQLSLNKEEGSKLWERATTALPNDKDFLTTWLNGSLAEDDWIVAQKAAMALRKAFPKERQYEFLNILLCYLIHQDGQSSDKERMLFGTLAYRMISKAAELAPTDKAQILAPGKAVSTPEELALLTKIYIGTAHEKEAIDLLLSENLGLTSKIAEHDPQMVFSLLIDALDSSKDNDFVLDVCQKILATDEARSRKYAEDDRVWRTLGRTARVNNDRLLGSCMDLIDTVLQRQPNCREIHLAKLDLLTHATETDDKRRGDLSVACEQYIETFGSKPFCFGDVVTALKASKTDNTQTIIQPADSNNIDEAQKMLSLKLEYSMSSGSVSEETDLLRFATKAIKLHKSLPKHKTDCPEAALLAALAMMRLAARSQDIVYALQASFILENTYSKYSDYYPLAVRLVQLHRSMGLMSLAMDKFGSLSIKNIQWETVGHLILTRISSLHPLQCDVAESCLSPLGAIDSGIHMLQSAEKSLDQQIKRGLEYGSYSNVLDSVIVKHNIKASINRQIYLIEERKIQALIGMPVETILEERPESMVDRRDFTFLETYAVEDGSLNNVLNCGTLPQDSWLDVMTLWDQIALVLRFESNGRTPEAEKAAAAFLKAWTKVKGKTVSGLTEAEASSHGCHQLLGEILVVLLESTKEQQPDIDNHLKDLMSWLNKHELVKDPAVNGVEVPSWTFIHTCFTRLQTLQTVALLVTTLSRKAKSKSSKPPSVPKNVVTELQEAVVAADRAIHQSARELKTAINEPGILGRLIEVVGGRLEQGHMSENPEYKALAEEYADTYDELALEEYCGKMKDSWEEALDGILAIEVKMTK